MDPRLTIPYESRLCRLEYRPFSDDPERILNLLVQNKFNLVVSSATRGRGYALYDSKIRPHSVGMDPKYLPTLIDMCHRNDIMILSWVPFNMQAERDTTDYFVPAHLYPEWTAKYIDSEGHKTADQLGVTSMCMLSTPYREKNADFVDEILGLGFDGIWFDGFMSYGMPGVSVSCVCQYCSEQFKADKGMQLPERIDWSDPTFLQYVSWRYDKLIASGEYMLRRIEATKSDAAVQFNTHSFPNSRFDWRWAVPLRKTRLGSSQHTGLGPTNGIQQHPLVSKVAHAQNPDLADVWQPIYATREVPENWIPDQPPNRMTMRLSALSAITQGVFPWYGGSETHINIFKEINEEVQLRQPVFSGKDVKYIGVVMSDRTKDFYDNRSDNPHRETYRDNIWGIDSMLAQHQLINTIIFDEHLEKGDLDDFKIIVLSNTACLSQHSIDNLTNWVSRGGILIATFETSLYDEWGGRKQDFGLAHLFGTHYLDTNEDTPESVLRGSGDPMINPPGAGQDVVPPEEAMASWRHEMAAGSLELLDPSLNEGQNNASFYGAYVRFEVKNDEAETIARSMPISGRRTMSVWPWGVWQEPKVEEVRSGRPEIVQHPYGSGNVIYFGSDIGLSYFRWPEKNTRLILSNLVRRLSPPDIEIEAPTVVIATARMQVKEGRLVIHLLNLPHASNRATNLNQGLTVDEVLPIHNIRITLNNLDVAEAKAFVRDEILTLEHHANGNISTSLPLLEIHEAIVFSLENNKI